jgi:hypothetical protein
VHLRESNTYLRSLFLKASITSLMCSFLVKGGGGDSLSEGILKLDKKMYGFIRKQHNATDVAW